MTGQRSLPQAWADDGKRRVQCHVPTAVTFQEKWRLALSQWERCRSVPHGWVAGDDEMGKVPEFRGQLHIRGEHYLLDVPSNTLVRTVRPSIT